MDLDWIWIGSGLDWIGSGLDWIGSGLDLDWIGLDLDQALAQAQVLAQALTLAQAPGGGGGWPREGPDRCIGKGSIGV